jgi:poly(3-hydroxyalkanoate) synthetase
MFGPVNIDNIWRIRNNMKIDDLIEGADIVRFIKAQKSNVWGISKEWTKPDQLEATRLETYGNQTSRKTKTMMARRCHGRSKKAENQKLEGDS